MKKWTFNFKKNKENFSNKIVNEKKDFDPEDIFEVDNFNFWYNNKQKYVLKNINLKIKKNCITSLIGPSGCGKSTFLSTLNRMNDLVINSSFEGNIFFLGKNINSRETDILLLRTKIGMVFQKPSPFPMSIYENIAYVPKNRGIKQKALLDKIVEKALKDVALWDEVKNNLDDLGTGLSGGQQQRLCIARAIAMEPEVLLMDEPTSALDPIATSKIEELVLSLKEKYTIIIVTHSMAQAQRISDETVFFYEGNIIEKGSTKQVFMSPKEKRTKDYINGRIG